MSWNRHLRAVLAAGLAVASLVGCSQLMDLGAHRGGAYPEACAHWQYSESRCAAIVHDAMKEAGIAASDVEAIALLPFERVQSLGIGQVALVRFRLADGSIVDQDVQCGGVSMRQACNDVAEIQAYGGVGRDVPCWGEPPAGCATLPPTPDPAAIDGARPFQLDAIDIPLDHEGTYDVELGTATLPNGYLSEVSYRLVDTRPADFWIDEGVHLGVRPDIEGRPPVGSVYRDPFDGPEPVTVVLNFEVTRLDAPSILQVRDIAVR